MKLNSPEAVKVSRDLQHIAQEIDRLVKRSAGRRVSFSLFVWTDARANYISNSTDRAEIKRALLSVIDGWEVGMPDVPAHEVQ